MISARDVFKPEARNVKYSLQGYLLEVIMDIVHHHLEIMVLEEGEIDSLVEFELCAFEDERNDSEVLVEVGDLVLSEVPSIIISEVRPHTEEGCVLRKTS